MSREKRNQLNPDELLTYYLSLGKGKRSYRKVAKKFNCSIGRVEEIGRDNKWVEQAKKYDKEVQDEVIERLKEEEINTRILLDTANQESILTYINMIKGKSSISVENAKVLDILGRLWKELEVETGKNPNEEQIKEGNETLDVEITIVKAGGDYED